MRRQGNKETGGGVEAARWLPVEGQGMVAVNRLVAVGRLESMAMKRLLGAAPLDKIVSLTGGKKRRSLLIMDSGHLIITALTVEEIGRLLRGGGAGCKL